eukprot:scaffold20811_cov97-Isochrysis_galbana.AAC.3
MAKSRRTLLAKVRMICRCRPATDSARSRVSCWSSGSPFGGADSRRRRPAATAIFWSRIHTTLHTVEWVGRVWHRGGDDRTSPGPASRQP